MTTTSKRYEKWPGGPKQTRFYGSVPWEILISPRRLFDWESTPVVGLLRGLRRASTEPELYSSSRGMSMTRRQLYVLLKNEWISWPQYTEALRTGETRYHHPDGRVTRIYVMTRMDRRRPLQV